METRKADDETVAEAGETKGNFFGVAMMTFFIVFGIILVVVIVLFVKGQFQASNSAAAGGSATAQAALCAETQTYTLNGGSFQAIQTSLVTPCQSRVHVVDKGCLDLYDSNHRLYGKTCADTHDTFDGIGYGIGNEGTEAITAMVTLCPLRSPGNNIGSCD